MSVHVTASQGYSTAADTYVRGRPDYPPEVAGWLTGTLGLGAGQSVLDLGAGTGKFIPLLRQTGARLLAVEPVEAMRDQLARLNGDVEVHAGAADTIPLPDASVDAVVCAQAFHWFATKEALAEIRRVLVVGGMLGLIWNGRDESIPWVAALSEITNAYEGATPRYRTGEWRRAFPAEGFALVDEQLVGNAHVGSPEHVIVDRTLSTSFIAALPQEMRDQIAHKVRDLVQDTPELAGQSQVAFPYETRMVAYRKTA